MSNKPIKNIAASVRERLMLQARKDKRPFDELLQYAAMDRFLYRWSKSNSASYFILKGALMLRVWSINEQRATRDIDMLAKDTRNDLESITTIIQEVMALDVEPDGFVFSPETVTMERITEDADYQGVRVKFIGKLDGAKVSMQIDIGFGDIVYPAPMKSRLPETLNFPPGEMLCYSRESAIAEKLQALVYLGDANSRMKDFYDIYFLSRASNFIGSNLANAIRLTFENRDTEIPATISSFSREFIAFKQIQWQAFRKKLDQKYIPESFEEIVTSIEKFIMPIINIILTNDKTDYIWTAPGPWLEN
ncbi:nucleotidyl transferase AbiEii/AbiGii toxin family protein [Fulvivirgaceae bacterium PWU5]|uniref:Nucleotidyl transferase AbiEii/AbiGii toxin family protein n=1 Tax=Dawidia cretensis TaxID=2782350 RepID=A0AAP2E215_9BACT|nr:nucleotidyl transferase AbiEii/AbiGii toxin family protein [Dawidia cretensis]MBT1711541.1 nucleotidyl transferase AbiEii/AbiGii toxin family protein [Dawidia cretensis]